MQNMKWQSKEQSNFNKSEKRYKLYIKSLLRTTTIYQKMIKNSKRKKNRKNYDDLVQRYY